MITPDELQQFENGEMEDEQAIALFQELIDTGQAWLLGGEYIDRAMMLIEMGLVTLGVEGHLDLYGNYIPSKFEVKEGTKGSEQYYATKIADHESYNT